MNPVPTIRMNRSSRFCTAAALSAKSTTTVPMPMAATMIGLRPFSSKS